MWSDGIYSLQKKKEKDPTMLPWQVGSLILISFAQFANILTVYVWVREFELFDFSFINEKAGSIGNNDLLMTVFLLIPLFLLNYFSIIYRKRYLTIMKTHPPKNEKGWSMILYFIISAALLLIPLFICSKILNILKY